MLKHMVDIKYKDNEKTIFSCNPKYGEGTIVSYELAEGIGVYYSDYIMNAPYGYCGEYDRINTLEFNYCISGKYEIEYSDQTVSYLTDGDFSVWSGKGNVVAADSSFKRYKGITIYIDVVKSENSLRQIIRDKDINIRTCVNKTLSGKTIIIGKPGVKILHIFNELYDLPSRYILDYIRIKVSELLLLVYTGDFNYDEFESKYYPLTLIHAIKKVKVYIEENYSEHLTISDLARFSYINKRKLMECFKYIYGMTINECIQKTRMTKARDLLLNSDYKIGEISPLVGYENASKFSEMFKRYYGLTPIKYKKENLISINLNNTL